MIKTRASLALLQDGAKDIQQDHTASNFEFWSFDIVSDFEFRASDFLL